MKPELDGIIIRSSQTGGKGRNLVLFNRASYVEEDDSPKESVKSVQIDFDGEAGEEDDNRDIIVFETVLPNPPEEESEPKTLLNISDTLRVPLPSRYGMRLRTKNTSTASDTSNQPCASTGRA